LPAGLVDVVVKLIGQPKIIGSFHANQGIAKVNKASPR
jgi:hypothetical protein